MQQKHPQACNRFTYFHSRMLYHDLAQAIINCGGILAFNGGGGAVFTHTIDAPCVTLFCLRVSHSAPSNDRGFSSSCCLCKHNHTSMPLRVSMLPGVLSAYVYSTFCKGTDNAHVFCAQIQEGVCVRGQPHELHSWVLEHQVFGRCIVFRGEEVKALKRPKVSWLIK